MTPFQKMTKLWYRWKNAHRWNVAVRIKDDLHKSEDKFDTKLQIIQPLFSNGEKLFKWLLKHALQEMKFMKAIYNHLSG